MKLSESSSDDEDFGIQTNGGVSTDSIAKVSLKFKYYYGLLLKPLIVIK